MDLHALAQLIARELVNSFQKENGGPCAKILAPRDSALLARLKEALDPGTKLLFLDDGNNGLPCDRYILPHLSCSQMADIAVGRAGDEQTSAVLRLLLEGIRVEVLEFEYKMFSQSAPGPLYDLYTGYETTLASYGLVALKTQAPERLRVREDLITARHVAEAAQTGARSLLVPAKAIVTPAALDKAQELHLSIEKSA